MRCRLILPLVLAVACLAGAVLAGQPLAPPSAERVAFDAWLDAQARTALESRRAQVAALTTRESVEARQRQVRASLAEALGLLPPSPAAVSATITRTTSREGYRIEHLWFESVPGLRVTANAYVPDGPGPFPVVLGTAGHADEGKAAPIYQHAWVSLARRGFLVLAYDPFGQGERIEYPGTAAGTSRVGIGTGEHTMTGQQVLLTGRTLGAYMVKDMQRALDYLVSRPDVDPTRLAVAGNSGGGTQAALLGAVDSRLAAIVVSCYMTSWADMWTTPGPQDAEQILPGFVGRGLDFSDFALAAAPRGFLVSSAIRDFFPIAGSRAASAELTSLYAALGAPDHLARVENDATHGWSQPLREGAYRALGAWLGRPVVPATEAPVTPEPLETLRVTETGQLSSSGGSRTARSLNADEAAALATTRPAVTASALQGLVGQLDGVPAARIVERRGDAMTPAGEHLIVEVLPGVRLRAWLRRPAAPAGPAVLLVDDKGATLRGATVDTLVAGGQPVLALDIRGTGDLGPRVGVSGYAPAYQFASRAWLLGTSVVAWQAHDITAGVRLLQSLALSPRGLHVRAAGQTAPAALFAAQTVRPDQVVLEESLVSYLDLAKADVHSGATLAVVPGVLRVTDLPELMARLAPARVHLLRPRTAGGQAITAATLDVHLGQAAPANVDLRH